MPDMQSELTKVLTQAHFDDEPNEPAPTANRKFIKGKIFDYVKANPVSSYTEIAEGLGCQDLARVASTLKSMIDEKILVRSKPNGIYCYTTAVNEYTEFDRMTSLQKAIEARVNKIKTKQAKKRLAPVTKATAPRKPASVPLPNNTKFVATVPQLLSTLSVVQARELYDELKKIFGG